MSSISIEERFKVGMTLQYGKQERIALQRARDELTEKFTSRFHKLTEKLNSGVSQEKLDLVENALWQHRTREANEPLPYSPDHPSSIEHKRHPYGIQRGWTLAKLLKETRGQHLVTTETPIKESEGYTEAKIVQLAIRYLATGRGRDKLDSIAAGKSKAAKFASQYLAQMAGL